jgi:hypothetical protein
MGWEAETEPVTSRKRAATVRGSSRHLRLPGLVWAGLTNTSRRSVLDFKIRFIFIEFNRSKLGEKPDPTGPNFFRRGRGGCG